ncbi:hypothetical protein [Fundidesulfovibrio putealis]|uniref:hypothetical protein n=1 Tax=Fundidesulfovibrio putealis TaxID=270496 RepID=UPI0004806F96|nr:hypothetical protein [Fundidesulfovibrio putealis]
MSTEVNHDSGDTGDTGEHGGYQGGDNGQESGYGHDDSGFSNSGNDEDQNGYGHESASEDEGHQFSTVQEHMGFTTGFGPAADLPRNAFGVPDYRGFSMPDNKANSLSFGKSPESYGTQRNMTFGTSFDPNNDLRKNAFGVPEYRGFRMPSGGMYSPGNSPLHGENRDDGQDDPEIAQRAKPVRDWLVRSKIVDPETSYISGIPKEAWDSLTPEAQEKFRERIDSGVEQLLGLGASLPVGGAAGLLKDGAWLASRLATWGNIVNSGVIGALPGIALNRMNQPLQEHPGTVWTGQLDRAASGRYD